MTSQAKEKYSAEFKENAVKRANESGNVAETAGTTPSPKVSFTPKKAVYEPITKHLAASFKG